MMLMESSLCAGVGGDAEDGDQCQQYDPGPRLRSGEPGQSCLYASTQC